MYILQFHYKEIGKNILQKRIMVKKYINLKSTYIDISLSNALGTIAIL